MISVQAIVDRMNFELDSEGSDRYIFERDHLPAINAAQDWLVSLFNTAFAENKLSEESLRELTRTRVWITSNRSTFAFDAAAVGDYLWTVLAVFPEITYSGVLEAQPSLTKPVYCTVVVFLDSTEQAKRITIEEYTEMKRSPFMAGSEILGWADYKEYAYVNFMDYDTAGVLTDPVELRIAPAINNLPVAMSYLKYPTTITLITDDIEFPQTLTDLIVNKALQFIALKQGDENATLYKLTSSEIGTLIGLMS